MRLRAAIFKSTDAGDRCQTALTARTAALSGAHADRRSHHGKVDRASRRKPNVLDESHLHAGHAGRAAGGQTHFRVHIVSEAFAGKSRIERHRMINAAARRRACRAACMRWPSIAPRPAAKQDVLSAGIPL